MSEIEELYREDINDRHSRNWDKATREDLQWLGKRDRTRKNKVISLYKAKKIKTAKNYHHAAFILQHGEGSKDFELAHSFADRAVKLGDKSAKWLYAATLDKWLLSTEKPQKFGTQFRKEGDEWKLAEPIDSTVTDEERARFNVPPLSEALEKFKEKYSDSGSNTIY